MSESKIPVVYEVYLTLATSCYQEKKGKGKGGIIKDKTKKKITLKAHATKRLIFPDLESSSVQTNVRVCISLLRLAMRPSFQHRFGDFSGERDSRVYGTSYSRGGKRQHNNNGGNSSYVRWYDKQVKNRSLVLYCTAAFGEHRLAIE